MKRAIIGLVAAAALALPALSQVPQAHAESFDGCTAGEVDVTGTASVHKYNFVMQCPYDRWGTFRVQGAFDVFSGKAQERLTSVAGPHWESKTVWTCSEDPWSKVWLSIGKEGPCTNEQAAVSGATENLPEYFQYDWTRGQPYSARLLSPQAHHVMYAQLQNALRRTPADPGGGAQPQPRVTDRVGTALQNAPEVVIATRPDLVAVGVQGNNQPSAGINGVYNVVVRNDGGGPANGNVELTISVSGPLKIDSVVNAGNFSCLPSGGLLQCKGGTLAQGAQATVQVRIYAAGAGAGTISASLNNSRTLHENDYSNNVTSLSVNVK